MYNRFIDLDKYTEIYSKLETFFMVELNMASLLLD